MEKESNLEVRARMEDGVCGELIGDQDRRVGIALVVPPRVKCAGDEPTH